MKDIDRLHDIDVMNNDYNNRVNEKIVSANDFIIKDVLPEIEIISNETERTIDDLITEVIEMQQSAKDKEKELRKKKAELENSLQHKIISGAVKFVHGALRFLSPVGHTAVHLNGQASFLSKGLSLGEQTKERISVQLPEGISFALRHQMDAIQNATFKAATVLRHQLDTLLEAIRQNPIVLGDMERKIEDVEERLNKIGRYDLENAKVYKTKLYKKLEGKRKS
jgi:hypothetical protein